MSKLVWFDGQCPFLTCLKTERHSHPVCPECGALRYGNMFCKECRKQGRPGGLQWVEWQENLKKMGGK